MREDMNDPEVTMSNALTNTNLVAHEKALEAAGIAITLAMRVPAPLRSIADQVVRSASSVPANLAEGHGRTGRDRLHFWRIAYASAKEVDSHLRLLAQVGVRAMTWRLLNRNSCPDASALSLKTAADAVSIPCPCRCHLSLHLLMRSIVSLS
jgi:four helix bundle protein